jgi:hypothetical protein
MTAQPLPGSGRHPLGTVYLLHFDQRYEHAGHYTGFAEGSGLLKRLGEHAAGRGARLVEVITQAGISFRLARIWPGVTRARERQLKQQGGASRRCPICLDQPATSGQRHDQAGARAVPTRGTTPAQVRAFLELNSKFARPVAASPAKQWARVRGREQIELLTHGDHDQADRIAELQRRTQAQRAHYARHHAEDAFDRLNPDFAVPVDTHNPAGHHAVQQRETALALGTRAAVAITRENQPNPLVRVAGQDDRVAAAVRTARHAHTRQGPERSAAER